MLRVVEIRIPGRWSDAWLYKEHLILWSRDGVMNVVPFKQIAASIRRISTRSQCVAIEHLVLRNDWKVSEQFRKLISIESVLQGFLAEIPESGESLVIDLTDIEPVPLDSEPIPGTILDSTMYANRVYVGSTEGLFETYFSPDNPYGADALRQRLEFRTSAVNARYSAINSSNGNAGLWFAPIVIGEDYGWWGDSPNTEQFTLVADYSRNNAFSSRHLLNYGDDAIPTFLRAHEVRERPHERAQYDTWRVVGYEGQAQIGGLMLTALEQSRKVQLSEVSKSNAPRTDYDIQVLGNSNYRLLVDWNESLHVVDISAFKGKEIEVRPDQQFQDRRDLNIGVDSIIGTYAVGSGFVIELWDELRLMTSRGSYVLAQERAARVRTFAESRRHKDAVLVVGEEAISLLGFLEVPRESD